MQNTYESKKRDIFHWHWEKRQTNKRKKKRETWKRGKKRIKSESRRGESMAAQASPIAKKPSMEGKILRNTQAYKYIMTKCWGKEQDVGKGWGNKRAGKIGKEEGKWDIFVISLKAIQQEVWCQGHFSHKHLQHFIILPSLGTKKRRKDEEIERKREKAHTTRISRPTAQQSQTCSATWSLHHNLQTPLAFSPHNASIAMELLYLKTGSPSWMCEFTTYPGHHLATCGLCYKMYMASITAKSQIKVRIVCSIDPCFGTAQEEWRPFWFWFPPYSLWMDHDDSPFFLVALINEWGAPLIRHSVSRRPEC